MSQPIIRVDDTKLQTWIQNEDLRDEESLRLFQMEGSQIVTAEMQQRVPIRTGFLRESVTTYMTGDGFTVYPAAPYAPYVEKGTMPHTIFPIRARVLRFQTSEGTTVFARRVQHPGFPGRWFVRSTAEAVRGRLADLVEQIFRRVYRV